jgi:hypothetical protein
MIVRKDNLKGFRPDAPMPIYWGVTRAQ